MSLRTPILPTLAAALALAGVHPAAAQRCRIPAGEFLTVEAGPIEIEPGQVRALRVGTSRGPFMAPNPLPRGCAVRWSLDARAPARIDAQGRLQIGAHAAPGTEFRVHAAMGSVASAQAVHVVDPRLSPVAGTWRQAQPAACTPAAAGAMEPVRELELRRDGRFTVTFIPFETYHDYWGRYTYDARTGALTLRVEGSNKLSAGVDLAGTARVANGRLTLDGFWLGQPNPSPSRACRYPFSH